MSGYRRKSEGFPPPPPPPTGRTGPNLAAGFIAAWAIIVSCAIFALILWAMFVAGYSRGISEAPSPEVTMQLPTLGVDG